MWKRFTATLFIIVKKWKQAKCLLTNGWENNMRHSHAMEYYVALKRNRAGRCYGKSELERHAWKKARHMRSHLV